MMGTDSRTMPGRSRTNSPPPERKKHSVKRPTLEVDGFSDDYLSVRRSRSCEARSTALLVAELIKRQALNEAGNVRAGRDDYPSAKQQHRPV